MRRRDNDVLVVTRRITEAKLWNSQPGSGYKVACELSTWDERSEPVSAVFAEGVN